MNDETRTHPFDVDETQEHTMTHDAPTERPESGFHPVNLTHLVMGLVLAGLAGIWAAVTAGWLPVDDLRWILPVPWLVAGSAGLLAAVLGGRRRERVARRDGQVGVVGDDPVHPGA